MTAQAQSPETHTHSLVADVSREIVHIYSSFYGRGPTKAKTVMHNDTVVVILEEIFTKAEQVLVQANQFAAVRAQRQAFQDETELLFRQVVEETTRRSVRAFLSQVTEEGIAAEVFVLVPEPEPSI